MIGERSGRRFRLSDRVRIKLMRVDMEQNKIDFRLVESGNETAGAVAPKKRGKRG